MPMLAFRREERTLTEVFGGNVFVVKLGVTRGSASDPEAGRRDRDARRASVLVALHGA